jgi:hypothetical protein
VARKIVAAVLAVAVLLILGAFLAIQYEARRIGRTTDRQRTEALAKLPVDADDYAAAVVAAAHDRAGPPDAQLGNLGRTRGAPRVWLVSRSPLVLIIRGTESYEAAPFGPSEVSACYRLAFTGLGSGTARYTVTPEATCPTRPPLS